MPAGIPPVVAHPGKPVRTLGDAARDGQLVTLRCNLCRRQITFLASDLADVFGHKHPIHVAPCECKQCGKYEYVRIRVRSPGAEDFGRLKVWRMKTEPLTRWHHVPLKLGDV
ncbi:hypothetical protein V8J82_22460 [Gymnodinialimonas sp. 2305UL16-5]|uniref:hypothetical protein n=1 Tax=Gymnodinialimonas mytili TaxID=3126503 RepID=UPI00309AD57F